MRRFPKRGSSGVRSQLEETLSVEEGPVLDETTFQQILAAAYVLQQQNDARSKSAPPPPDQPTPSGPIQTDAAQTLAQIVETQELVRKSPHDVAGAANLVARRLMEIVHAKGAAIALAVGDELEYCAAVGTATQLAGVRLPIGPELLALDAQAEGPLQHAPTNAKLAEDPVHACQENASIALPLHREGKLAGLIEVRFDSPDNIEEHEIRTCQLMAGLMTEAMARAAELEWRHILATERATMLEALEKIKPQLERLAVESHSEIADLSHEKDEKTASPARASADASDTQPTLSPAHESTTCPECGYKFSVGELFCGRCGSKRPAEVSGDLQSKWASLWELQKAVEKESEESNGSPGSEDAAFSPALEEIIAQFSDEAPLPKPRAEDESPPVASSALTINQPAIVEHPVPAVLPEQPNLASPWGSASKAHQWLASLEAKVPGKIWAQRANIYIAFAFILLLAVLVGWDSQPPTRNPRIAQPRLSLLEKTLLALGLAEAPPPQAVYRGNPNALVWIDLHTAQYYCQGAESYGKPGGRETTQRDAQLDQFEPAARKPCD